MCLAAAVMRGFPAVCRHSPLAGILQFDCYRVPAAAESKPECFRRSDG